ncbi:polyhomeotic-like protein 2b isoform X2 [Hypomesus transpacificus]|nr:polyhomeotic-like protein 2b isoform X2 [Hypomesus transpacificus]
MDSDQGAAASTATGATSSTTSTSTMTTSPTPSTPSSSAQGGVVVSGAPGGAGRQVSQISVYSGISDRQTVQVIQQALHRGPSSAAQYLQQMYAAQQQHLMLQTAALQQQHSLQTAALQQQHSLQSLAAAQQASLAAGRQSSTQHNGGSALQPGAAAGTINLSPSPAAQLISRAQGVSSSPATISQQTVLLGPQSSPTFASQAHMYLRAQMAQQSNLVQVARTLGRAVPLSPQLIFTPTATVTAVQSESSSKVASSQVQNLALRGPPGLQALSLKQSPAPIQPSTPPKTPSQGAPGGPGGKPGTPAPLYEGGRRGEAAAASEGRALNMKGEAASEGRALNMKGEAASEGRALNMKGEAASEGRALNMKGEAASEGRALNMKGEAASEGRALNMSRSVTVGRGSAVIAPAYTQIQPHSLVIHHKQQCHIPQRAPLLQTASIQPHLHTPGPVQPRPSGPPQAPPASYQAPPANHQAPPANHQAPPANHQAPPASHQATIFHSTISPHHTLHPGLSQAKAQPVQLTPINLQIQPTASQVRGQASRLDQDSKDKPTSLVVRETPPPAAQQSPAPSPVAKPSEPPKPAPATPNSTPVATPTSLPSAPAESSASTKRVSSTPSPGTRSPPANMTSGNESEVAPVVAGSAPQNGENKPPQAIVKPQVLTHVIEGFVIQEGAEPFPIERFPLLVDSPKKDQLSSDPDKTPGSNPDNSTDSEAEDQELKEQEEADVPKLTCEYCGWVDFNYKFKGSKRFCSMVCAKRYNVGCTKRMGLFRPERSKPTNRWRRRSVGRPSVEAKKQKLSPTPSQPPRGSTAPPTPSQPPRGSTAPPLPSQPNQGESSPCSDTSSDEEPPSPASPLSAASSGPPQGPPQGLTPTHHPAGRGSEQEAMEPPLSQHFMPTDATQWKVGEVYQFIRSLPGCQEIAEEFRSQEIDGQALLLLKEDHLMSAMNIKLGPALKIFASINMLKDS